MSDELNNALVGSLVGLGLGALTRKLVAGKQDVSWGDYALWGGVGAGVGGAAGYGLTGIDPSKPSEQMLEAAEEKVRAAIAANNQAVVDAARSVHGTTPGFLQALSPSEWLVHGGAGLGVGAFYRWVVPKVDVQLPTKADIMGLPGLAKATKRLADAKELLRTYHTPNLFQKLRILPQAKHQLSTLSKKQRSVLKNRIARIERGIKRRYKIEKSLALKPSRSRLVLRGIRNGIPWLLQAANAAWAAYTSDNFADWWASDGGWFMSNPHYSKIKESDEALAEALYERNRLQQAAK